MKKSVLLSFLMAVAVMPASSKDYDYPFQNPKLSFEKRAENLLSLLTPEEKIGLMMNGSISIDRLDIPAYNWWN